MPVTFNILPHENLVVIRFSGFFGIAETLEQFRQYKAHRDYRDGQKHLFDFTAATGFERDYPEFLKMQATLAETYGSPDQEQLIVYVVPHKVAGDLAIMAMRSWDGTPNLVMRICRTVDEAVSILGVDPEALASIPDRA